MNAAWNTAPFYACSTNEIDTHFEKACLLQTFHPLPLNVLSFVSLPTAMILVNQRVEFHKVDNDTQLDWYYTINKHKKVLVITPDGSFRKTLMPRTNQHIRHRSVTDPSGKYKYKHFRPLYLELAIYHKYLGTLLWTSLITGSRLQYQLTSSFVRNYQTIPSRYREKHEIHWVNLNRLMSKLNWSDVDEYYDTCFVSPFRLL